jgi:hypothetical protein
VLFFITDPLVFTGYFSYICGREPCLTKEHIRELQILPDLEKHEYLNFNPGLSRISRPFWPRRKNVHRTERGRIQPFLYALGEEIRIADAQQLPPAQWSLHHQGRRRHPRTPGTSSRVPWLGIVGGRCPAASGLSSRHVIEALRGHVHFRTSGKWPTSTEVTAAEESPGLRVLHAGTGSARRELEASTRPRWSTKKRDGNGS